jgi:GTPase
VVEILADLGVERDDARVVEVWNKIDLLDETRRERVAQASGAAQAIAVSATTGEGLQDLLAEIERRISGPLRTVELSLGPAEHGQLDWIYRHAQIVRRIDRDDGGTELRVRAPDTTCRLMLERLAAARQG